MARSPYLVNILDPDYDARGRAKNSPNVANAEKEIKDKRLELRAAAATLKKLDWIREHSGTLKGKSNAEIIACLISDHVTMQELFNYNLPRYK